MFHFFLVFTTRHCPAGLASIKASHIFATKRTLYLSLVEQGANLLTWIRKSEPFCLFQNIYSSICSCKVLRIFWIICKSASCGYNGTDNPRKYNSKQNLQKIQNAINGRYKLCYMNFFCERFCLGDIDKGKKKNDSSQSSFEKLCNLVHRLSLNLTMCSSRKYPHTPVRNRKLISKGGMDF